MLTASQPGSKLYVLSVSPFGQDCREASKIIVIKKGQQNAKFLVLPRSHIVAFGRRA